MSVNGCLLRPVSHTLSFVCTTGCEANDQCSEMREHCSETSSIVMRPDSIVLPSTCQLCVKVLLSLLAVTLSYHSLLSHFNVTAFCQTFLSLPAITLSYHTLLSHFPITPSLSHFPVTPCCHTFLYLPAVILSYLSLLSHFPITPCSNTSM